MLLPVKPRFESLSLFNVVLVVVIFSSDFVFVYIIITSGLGLMYAWFFFLAVGDSG